MIGQQAQPYSRLPHPLRVVRRDGRWCEPRAFSVHSSEWTLSFLRRIPSMSPTSVSRLAAAFVLVGVLAACADSPTTSPSAVSSELAPQDAPALSAGVAAAHIPGRFIVTLRAGADARGVAREHGVAPDFVYSTVLNGFAGSISDAARAGLLRDGRVARIEQDGVVTTQTTESGATWGLDRTDQRALPLNTTYSYNSTGAGVTAYIIDKGIRFAHSEL